MTDFETAEKILKSKGWLLIVVQDGHPYYMPPDFGTVTCYVVTQCTLRTNPKKVISSLGYDWDEEVAKLGICQPISIPAPVYSAMHGSVLTGTPTGAAALSFEAISSCSHTWKAYTGLSESFDFCTKCDEKRSPCA